MGLVRSSYIPSKDFRILREFTRYRYKLTNTKSSEKNRFTNALTVGNCKLDMVFTDIFGKSSQSIIDVIMNNNNFLDEDIISCLRKNCKSSHEDILSSISGIQFTYEQKLRINIVKDHIDYLNNQISKLNDIIDTLVAPYESYIDLLCTVPCIDRNSAIGFYPKLVMIFPNLNLTTVLHRGLVLHLDVMNQLTRKNLLKFLVPMFYLKPYLVEIAHNAVKDKTNSYYAKKHEKISKRRDKKRAIIAIARKILVAIYHSLKLVRFGILLI